MGGLLGGFWVPLESVVVPSLFVPLVSVPEVVPVPMLLASPDVVVPDVLVPVLEPMLPLASPEVELAPLDGVAVVSVSRVL